MKGFQHFLQTFRCVSSSRRIERFRNVHKYYVNTVSFEVRVFIPSRPLSYQYLINPVTGSDYSPPSLRTPEARVLSFTPHAAAIPGGAGVRAGGTSENPWPPQSPEPPSLAPSTPMTTRRILSDTHCT